VGGKEAAKEWKDFRAELLAGARGVVRLLKRRKINTVDSLNQRLSNGRRPAEAEQIVKKRQAQNLIEASESGKELHLEKKRVYRVELMLRGSLSGSAWRRIRVRKLWLCSTEIHRLVVAPGKEQDRGRGPKEHQPQRVP
jgi:hypothetical protein